MSLTKMFKKLTGNHMILTTVLVSVALIYFIQNYSSGKSIISEGVSNAPSHAAPVQSESSAGKGCNNGAYQPSAPMGQNTQFGAAAGMNTNNHGLAVPGSKQASVDPSELLPKNGGNDFSKMNPGNASDIRNISLLKAGHHIGINTVGNSLRNPNLQLRSEPANPQVKVSPWMNTTIEPDTLRKPLEASCRQ